MQQPIAGFRQDEEGHWVAELACGHTQHVRHDPPWQNRPWTQAAEGRAQALGQPLDCRKCEQGAPHDVAPVPFYREAGQGTGVVCIHSNSASSSQWRALMEQLAPQGWRVLAADSYGSGKTAPWPAAQPPLTLGDEVALLAPVIARAGEPLALVGHSYGGAVALLAALSLGPGRVRALALYEPTLFALIEQQTPDAPSTEGIRGAVARVEAAIGAGDPAAAARHFIDYWMAPGAFDAMPPARQAPIVATIAQVRDWGRALFTEPTPAAAFAALDIPVLLMTGAASPLSSRALAARLAQLLPRCEVVEFAGLGHMGPLTHPAPVNEAVAGFLEREFRTASGR